MNKMAPKISCDKDPEGEKECQKCHSNQEDTPPGLLSSRMGGGEGEGKKYV
jgi:hypothetical protein